MKSKIESETCTASKTRRSIDRPVDR